MSLEWGVFVTQLGDDDGPPERSIAGSPRGGGNGTYREATRRIARLAVEAREIDAEASEGSK